MMPRWLKRGLIITVIGGIIVLSIWKIITTYIWKDTSLSDKQSKDTFIIYQHSEGDQSPVNIAGRDLIINQLPIPKDIKNPPPLGKLEFDSNYKRARSYMLAGNYKKAADLFKPIYEIKPDYPTLALHYGDCLARVGNKEEALAVWLSIPPNEKYIFKNFNTGILLYDLKRYRESVHYFKLAQNDFKRNDCRYWNSRAFFIVAKNEETSLEHLISDVNEFTEVVDNDVRNLINYKVKKDTKYELDKKEALSEILGRNSSAFYLLYIISWDLFCKRNIHSESLDYALSAAEHLNGPVFGCPLTITKQYYLNFLQHLSHLLCYEENKDYNKSKLNLLMEKIEKQNNNKKNQEISDFAMLIRSFHGDSKSIRPVKKANFEITYAMNIRDNSGIKSITIESPKYLLGREEINIDGKKKYHYEQVITINPKVVLIEKPYFRTTVENINGINSHFDPCPRIKIIE